MSKKQNESDGVSNETTSVFDGIKRTAETTIFESKAIKQQLLVGTEDEIKSTIKSHTLKVEFDFTGLTVDECVNQLVSTTSFMKLFQNNIIGNTDKRWDEQEILNTVAKGTYHVSCRSLLDDRTRREADPLSAIKRYALKAKEKGLTKQQIIDSINEKFGDIL
jgi:hypothetical protein